MSLKKFKEDYPEIFDAAVNDLDWDKIFELLESAYDPRVSGKLSELLNDHFESYIDHIDPYMADPDAIYDRKKQEAADNGELQGFNAGFREFVQETFGGKK